MNRFSESCKKNSRSLLSEPARETIYHLLIEFHCKSQVVTNIVPQKVIYLKRYGTKCIRRNRNSLSIHLHKTLPDVYCKRAPIDHLFMCN